MNKFTIVNTCGSDDCCRHNEDDKGAFYLASEVDARIAELEKALVDLVTGHNGYHQGVGPCICAAHEEARRVLGMTRDDAHQTRTL
jgi:hypothetical protein